jgi:hypothetical protein
MFRGNLAMPGYRRLLVDGCVGMVDEVAWGRSQLLNFSM